MSRFFHGGLSDSESSSSEEEDLYSGSEQAEEESSEGESSEEESDEPESELESDDEGGSRFLKGAESDDSDTGGNKRVVKSAKDKRQEEIESSIKIMDNAQKINDWVAISNGAVS